MTGGNQLKLSQYVVGHARSARRSCAAHQRGAVVAGTSAGASIMSLFMISMGEEGVTPRQRASQLTAGLGLLPDVIVDQHFDQRARYGRLLSIVATSPNLLGLGIDEDTAAEVTRRPRPHRARHRARCSSSTRRGAVSDAPEARRDAPLLVSGAVVHSLPTGATFDLRTATLTTFVEQYPDAMVKAEVAGREGHQRGHRGPAVPTEEIHMASALPTPRAPPRRTSRSWRPGSTAAPTSGPTSRRSTSSSTSAAWRTTPATPCDGFTDRLLELLPGPGPPHLLARGRRAASSSGCTRAPGSVTSPSTSRCSCSRRPATTCAGARPGRSRAGAGVYNVIYAYTDERVGLAAGQLAVRLVNHLVQPEEGFDFAEELDLFLRRAERTAFGPVDRRRSSRRRSAATSRGSGSTSTPWSSSARASTPSASGPR